MAQTRPKTRREFVQLALTAAAGSALTTYTTPASAQALPVTRLRVGLTPPANQVTLGYRGQGADNGQLSPMCEALVGSDRFTGELVPQLATSWQRSADGRTWTFKLRPNTPFHDGTIFSAKDVPFSWQLLTSPASRASNAPVWRGLVKSVDDIKVVNDLEVVFNLARPEPELLYFLSPAVGMTIYSKDYWDKVGEAGYAKLPIGTGPFRFREFKPGEYILYERVENHWRQTPEFKELQFLYMPEDATRLAALLNGEIHIAEMPRALQSQAVARGMKIAASTLPAVQVSGYFGGNNLAARGAPGGGPLTNVLVRQAMNIAVNRQEINEQIYGGRGTIEIVQPYQPEDPAFNPAWKPYPYDPAKAKALLAQAGFPNGFDFDMTVVTPPGFPEFPDLVQALAIYFKQVGLRPRLLPMEMAALIDRQRAATLQNTLASNRQSIQPLYFYVPNNYSSKGVQHFFEDPYFESAFTKFRESVDEVERLQILKDVGNFLYEQYATLPLLFLYAEVGVNPKVVAEYKADIGFFGASVGHEYTKAAT